ncbi:hypothetical protein [Kordia sp.]|uniref:hypothetical protein n=1 Tax=Kordia sp. TaxID=1965332 RepID=UPI003B5996FA
MEDSGSVMEIVQLLIGIILIVSVYFIVIRTVFNRKRIAKLTGDDLKFDKIRAIYTQLKKGNNPKVAILKKYAESLEHRTLVYEALEKFNKINAFPKALLTLEKSSESYLANRLDMHDDFDSFPNEITYKETVELQNGTTFLIFKFKVYEPHLYANKDWMIGYVGYKTDSTKAYMKPDVIWSKFECELLSKDKLEKITSSTL